MPFVLSPSRQARLDQLMARYPNRMAACIPLLHLCQEQAGYISEEIMEWVALTCECPTSHVQGVASFYSRLEPNQTGKHRICICRSLSCTLKCGLELLESCENRLGIRAGETTSDGKITLRETQCLAACGRGPAMLVDDELHENVGERELESVLKRLTEDDH